MRRRMFENYQEGGSVEGVNLFEEEEVGADEEKDKKPSIFGAPMPATGMKQKGMGDIFATKQEITPKNYEAEGAAKKRMGQFGKVGIPDPLTGRQMPGQGGAGPVSQQSSMGDRWLGEVWQNLTAEEEIPPQFIQQPGVGGYQSGGSVNSAMQVYNDTISELRGGVGFARGGPVSAENLDQFSGLGSIALGVDEPAEDTFSGLGSSAMTSGFGSDPVPFLEPSVPLPPTESTTPLGPQYTPEEISTLSWLAAGDYGNPNPMGSLSNQFGTNWMGGAWGGARTPDMPPVGGSYYRHPSLSREEQAAAAFQFTQPAPTKPRRGSREWIWVPRDEGTIDPAPGPMPRPFAPPGTPDYAQPGGMPPFDSGPDPEAAWGDYREVPGIESQGHLRALMRDFSGWFDWRWKDILDPEELQKAKDYLIEKGVLEPEEGAQDPEETTLDPVLLEASVGGGSPGVGSLGSVGGGGLWPALTGAFGGGGGDLFGRIVDPPYQPTVPIPGFAHGGEVGGSNLRDGSADLASYGRGGDTMMMHVNPSELSGLESLLGPTSTNPHTGMPEAFPWLIPLAGLAMGAVAGGGFGDWKTENVLKGAAIGGSIGLGVGSMVPAGGAAASVPAGWTAASPNMAYGISSPAVAQAGAATGLSGAQKAGLSTLMTSGLSMASSPGQPTPQPQVASAPAPQQKKPTQMAQAPPLPGNRPSIGRRRPARRPGRIGSALGVA